MKQTVHRPGSSNTPHHLYSPSHFSLFYSPLSGREVSVCCFSSRLVPLDFINFMSYTNFRSFTVILLRHPFTYDDVVSGAGEVSPSGAQETQRTSCGSWVDWALCLSLAIQPVPGALRSLGGHTWQHWAPFRFIPVHIMGTMWCQRSNQYQPLAS